MKKGIMISTVILSLFVSTSFQCVSAGTTPPAIDDVDYSPRTPTSEDNVTVTALVVDNESGVDFVSLLYSVNSSVWNVVSMSNPSGSTYNGVIPKFSSGTQIQFKILAQDISGNPAESSVVTYVVSVHVSPTGIIFFMYILVVIAAMGITLTLLIWRVKPTAFCPNCGAKTTSRAIFCPECGKKIK